MPIVDRFVEAPLSRFLVTDLDGQTVTFLDRLASNRSATHTRNAPFELSCLLPSDNPEVNILSGSAYDDAEPFVEEGTKLVYWFLRYGETLSASSGPWECVGAAIILNIEDSADDEVPGTRLTAFDPWKLLYKLPVVAIATGELPSENFGITYFGSNAAHIAYQVLVTSLVNWPDFKSHIDYDVAFIDDTTETEITEINFTHGMTVGEALDELCRSEESLDIFFKPVYDPVARPGVLCEFWAGPNMGEEKTEAIFSWDRWPRSLVGISRQRDGEQRTNYLQYYGGQNQTPVPPMYDTDSIDEFGLYWETQSFPNKSVPELFAVELEASARRELRLRGRGLVTYTITPAAERMPILFKEFHIHDRVQVYASKRLRRPIIEDSLRVESIPVSIDDDQLARVQSLVVSSVPPEGS